MDGEERYVARKSRWASWQGRDDSNCSDDQPISDDSSASSDRSSNGSSDSDGALYVNRNSSNDEVWVVSGDYELASDEEWVSSDDDDSIDSESVYTDDTGAMSVKPRPTIKMNSSRTTGSANSVTHTTNSNSNSGNNDKSSIFGIENTDIHQSNDDDDNQSKLSEAGIVKEESPDVKLIATLGQAEKTRALEVFQHCDVFDEGKINEKSVREALSLLGLRETEEKIRELCKNRKVDLFNETAFLAVIGELRSQATDEEQLQAIVEAFDAIYKATLVKPNERVSQEDQRDALGRPYILAEDLRRVLVSTGDVMSDEEVDQLIRDCKPVDNVIFFDQYRAMLLNGPS
jgi:Ca2+-binding EF-hand superfamily protein